MNLSKFDKYIVRYCKGHYDKQAPTGLTDVEGLQLIWKTVCGHPEVYDSSLEYIAKKLYSIVGEVCKDAPDYVIGTIHENLMRKTTELPIIIVIETYISLIRFSIVIDAEGNPLYTFPPKQSRVFKRILNNENYYEDYKIFN